MARAVLGLVCWLADLGLAVFPLYPFCTLLLLVLTLLICQSWA